MLPSLESTLDYNKQFKGREAASCWLRRSPALLLKYLLSVIAGHPSGSAPAVQEAGMEQRLNGTFPGRSSCQWVTAVR